MKLDVLDYYNNEDNSVGLFNKINIFYYDINSKFGCEISKLDLNELIICRR